MEQEELEVKVISMLPNPPALQRLRVHFPTAQMHPATDLRNASAAELFRSGAVTIGALWPMSYGRR